MRSPLRAPLFALSFIVCAITLPRTAHAAIDDDEDRAPSPPASSRLRPLTRPVFLQANLGVLAGGYPLWNEFQFEQAAGYHVAGGAEGFAIGGALQERIGDRFTITFNARGQWDFRPIHSVGFYVTPFLAVGGGFSTLLGGAAGFVHIEPGVDLKLSFGDPFYLYLRPIGLPLDVFVSGLAGTVNVQYDFSFGGGFAL